MSALRRGKRRHGPTLKATYSVSLDPQVADNLRAMGRDSAGKDCLSRGVELAELIARGTPEIRRSKLLGNEPGWIVFELVDEPADPPRPGEAIELFQTETAAPLPPIFDPPL